MVFFTNPRNRLTEFIKESSVFKQSITYCIMSIIIILLKSYIASGLSYFNAGYQWFASMAAPLLQQAGLNNQLQTIVLIVLFPFLLVGIPGGIYYITKKKQMPYF